MTGTVADKAVEVPFLARPSILLTQASCQHMWYQQDSNAIHAFPTGIGHKNQTCWRLIGAKIRVPNP